MNSEEQEQCREIHRLRLEVATLRGHRAKYEQGFTELQLELGEIRAKTPLLEKEHADVVRELESTRSKVPSYSDEALVLENRDLRAELEKTKFLLSTWTDGNMTADELEIVGMFVAKVLGEGKQEHGDLDHDTDERSILELVMLEADELLDTYFYSLVKRVRRARGLA